MSHLLPCPIVTPAAEEEEIGAKSPEPQASGLLPPPAAPGQWRPQHFACDAPRCGRLLCRPVVLICGHAVCQDCLPACSNGGGGHGTAASPAAGAGTCAQTSPGGAAAGALACPACGLAARQAPALCKQLADLLAELFPGESSQREAEAHAARAACAEHEADAQAAATASAAAATAESPSATSPEAAAPPTAAAAAAAGETSIRAYTQQHDGAASGSASPPGGQPASPAAWQSLSPSLTSALRRRQAEGGAGQAMAERMEQSLLRMTAGEEYAWHGVGCDGCGEPAARPGDWATVWQGCVLTSKHAMPPLFRTYCHVGCTSLKSTYTHPATPALPCACRAVSHSGKALQVPGLPRGDWV